MVSTLNKWIVREYTDLVKGREGVVLLAMDRLDVQEAQEVRTAVRAVGARLRVAKQCLAQVALQDAGLTVDVSLGGGLAGLLVGDVESTLAAAKAIEKICEKAKDKRKIFFKSAWLDGALIGPAEAAGIPAMPDRQTVRGMLCCALAGPARALATVLRELPASTARALQARTDQDSAA